MMTMPTWERWRVEGCWRRTCQLQCFWHSWTSAYPRWKQNHYHNYDDFDDDHHIIIILMIVTMKTFSSFTAIQIFKNILRYSADNIWKWNTLDYHNRYRNYLHRNYLHIKKISWKQKEFGKLGGRILLYVCLLWKSWRKNWFLELFPTETRIMWVSDICSHLLTVSRARWYSLSAKSNSLNKN